MLIQCSMLLQCSFPDIVNNDVFVSALRTQLKKNPDMAALYEEKIKSSQQFMDSVKDRRLVLAERGNVREALHEVEKELRKTKEGGYPTLD